MNESGKRLFKKEYSVELLKIAKGDLESAKALALTIHNGRPENVVFLAQQSVEKALKAALNHLEIPFPLVHDLGILVALFPDKHMPPGGFSLAQLTPYATIRRYEEGASDLSQAELQAALDAAAAVLIWAHDLVSL